MQKSDRKHDAGKGDSYRPVDKKKYDANYEKIFGKGKTAGGFVCLQGDFKKDFENGILRKKGRVKS